MPKTAQDLVDVYFRQPVGIERGEFMPIGRALQIIGSSSVNQELNTRNLGRAFKDLGFKSLRTNASRGYIVVQRTGAEIQERQKRLAEESDEVTT